MSASLAKRIRDHSRSTGTARAALFTIATYCNEQRGDQTAWPGEEAIATSLHIKQRAVRDLFRELEALGELTIRRRARKTALLTIHLPDRKSAAGHMTGTLLPLIKHDRQSSVSMTGSTRARNGDNKKGTRKASSSLRSEREGIAGQLDALEGYVPSQALEDDVLAMDKRWPVAAALEKFAKEAKLTPRTQDSQVRGWLREWEGRLSAGDFREPTFTCETCGAIWTPWPHDFCRRCDPRGDLYERPARV